MDEIASTDSSASSDIPPQQQQKKKSNFVPGDPRIPMLVRVYGSIIAAISIEIMIFTVLFSIFLKIVFSFEKGKNIVSSFFDFDLFSLLFVGLILAFAYLLYRMGIGICNGEKSAIYGLTVVGGLTLVIALGIIISGSQIGGAVLFVFALALYLPPIWVSFRRWELFK